MASITTTSHSLAHTSALRGPTYFRSDSHKQIWIKSAGHYSPGDKNRRKQIGVQRIHICTTCDLPRTLPDAKQKKKYQSYMQWYQKWLKVLEAPLWDFLRFSITLCRRSLFVLLFLLQISALQNLNSECQLKHHAHSTAGGATIFSATSYFGNRVWNVAEHWAIVRVSPTRGPCGQEALVGKLR